MRHRQKPKNISGPREARAFQGKVLPELRVCVNKGFSHFVFLQQSRQKMSHDATLPLHCRKEKSRRRSRSRELSPISGLAGMKITRQSGAIRAEIFAPLIRLFATTSGTAKKFQAVTKLIQKPVFFLVDWLLSARATFADQIHISSCLLCQTFALLSLPLPITYFTFPSDHCTR